MLAWDDDDDDAFIVARVEEWREEGQGGGGSLVRNICLLFLYKFNNVIIFTFKSNFFMY